MRGRPILISGAAGLGTLLVVLGSLASFASGPRQTPTPKDSGPPATTSTAPARRADQVAPATTVPAETPVQQSYDDALAQGLSSASNRATIERGDALVLPRPAIGGGWPALGPCETPDGFVREFVTALLDVDFSRQGRSSLGAFLVAVSAPDLMPGIPASFGRRTLYTSVMAPVITGSASPIPSPTAWARYAREGVRFAVSEIEVQLDPGWQSMVDAGWQPRDLRAAVEDVSGVLWVTRGRSVTRWRFSVVVQVGSALYSDGYGAVLVSRWKESQL